MLSIKQLFCPWGSPLDRQWDNQSIDFLFARPRWAKTNSPAAPNKGPNNIPTSLPSKLPRILIKQPCKNGCLWWRSLERLLGDRWVGLLVSLLDSCLGLLWGCLGLVLGRLGGEKNIQRDHQHLSAIRRSGFSSGNMIRHLKRRK